MNRYPAPAAEEIWSDRGRVARLRVACDEYTVEALRGGLLGLVDARWAQNAIETVLEAPDPRPEVWRVWEQDCGHEIVGFLGAYLDRLPKDIRPYVHYGLTSSDLVEFDLHEAIASHAQVMRSQVWTLATDFSAAAVKYDGLERAGRTHGQTAESTTLGHQLRVFSETLFRHQRELDKLSRHHPVKTPGPTGFPTRAPRRIEDLVTSTQIIPRDILLRWASAYLNLSNTLETMAMFVRLGSRSEIGEFLEGGARDRQGSSAMPGKANPIQSEKVCGLARVARGQFLALAEVSALWEDRDLSNSSTERISVPGLAATVEHMLLTVRRVFEDLEIDEKRIRRNAKDPRCKMNARQCEIQKTNRVGPLEASRLVTQERST